MGGDLSDHALMQFARTADTNAPAAELRPKAANLGSLSRGDSLACVFRSRTEEEEWYAAVEASVGRALFEERSCLVEVTEALRALADRVIAEGVECGSVHGKSTALCELHSWGKRLSIAREARVRGANFFDFESLTLFHPRTGLRACGIRASSSDEAWGVLIRRARRQLRRAAKISHARVFKPERTLVNRCDEIDAMRDDPTGRAAAVRRVLSARGPGAGLILTKLYIRSTTCLLTLCLLRTSGSRKRLRTLAFIP